MLNEINELEILGKLQINNLNEMQLATATALAEHDKLILLSSTGSGKTLAFLLPLLRSLNTTSKKTQALILAPSRELVLQIESVLKKMQPGFKITSCYGGHKREIEEQNLVETPSIIIATAGRLGDHIRRKNVNLSSIEFLVVDEFDKILELGFLEEMEFIFSNLPAVKKRLLTSATYSSDIPAFVQMQDAHRIDFLRGHTQTVDALKLYSVNSPDKDKLETLYSLICYLRETSTIIFANHRESVERVSQWLTDRSIINEFYHGGMEQMDREVALCKFRNATSNVLVTTDLASRGLDIAHIRSIVHYHLPLSEEVFTHRNGRTARMDATGNAYLIISPEEKLPEYAASADLLELSPDLPAPEKPKWSTLFIAAGKKDKINKIDIVGFLSQVGKLKKDDIGLVEVKDFTAFAAVRKSKVGPLVELIKDEKIKNKKVKIVLAK